MILNTYYISDRRLLPLFTNGAQMMKSNVTKYSVVNTEYYIIFIAPELADSNRMLLMMYIGLKNMYGIVDDMLEGKLLAMPFQEEILLTSLLSNEIINKTLYREVQIPAGIVNVSLRYYKTTMEVSYDAQENSFTNR